MPSWRTIPVRALPLLLLPTLLPDPAAARTWRVLPDGTGDAPTIQAGVDSAAVGDTVELACGTYGETDIAMKSGVTLRSATGDPDCAILDALLLGRVFRFEDVDATTTIEGLTLTHGKDPRSWPENCGGALFCSASSPTILNCLFEDNQCAFDGGALWCAFGSSPRVEGCVFRFNSSGHSGGAFYAWENSLPVVVECTFRGNHAQHRGGAISLHGGSAGTFENCEIIYNWSGDEGGAVNCYESDPEFTGCSFGHNTSPEDGGAVWVGGSASAPSFSDCLFEENRASEDGGGIAVDEGRADIVECRFLRNSADSEGGGLFYIEGEAATKVIACRFEENAAEHGGGAYGRYSPGIVEECVFTGNTAGDLGGGLMLKRVPSHTVRTCLFHGNTAGRGGGAAFWEGESTPEFSGCTVAGNEAAEGGGLYAKESNPTIGNTIIAFNGPGGAVGCGGGGDPSLSCSDLFGNTGGDWVGCVANQAGMNDNFSDDPLFCDAGFDDYTLAANSPCLDAPGCGLVGALGEGCGGTTGVEVVTWGGIKKMFR